MTIKNQCISKKTRSSGFTLIEIIVAIAILGTISLICIRFIASSLTLRQKVLDQYPFEKVMNRIAQDISGAYVSPYPPSISGNSLIKSESPQFIYEPANSNLVFTVINNESLIRNSSQSNVALVSYYTKKPEDKLQLIRVVDAVMDPDKKLPSENAIILAEDIEEFKLTFWDGEKFQDSWDSKSGVAIGKLPKMVKVHLTVNVRLKPSDTKPTKLPLEMIVFVNTATDRAEVKNPTGMEYKWQ